MANILADEKRREMFDAWQEKQTVNSVVRKTGVSDTAVKRYRQIDNWDKRVRTIQQKVTRKLDNEAIKRQTKHQKTLDVAFQSYIAQLLGNLTVTCPHCNKQHDVSVPALKAQFSDFEKLIKTERLMHGESDEQKDIVIRVEYR